MTADTHVARPRWTGSLGLFSIVWGLACLPCCMPIGCIYNRVVLPPAYLDFLRSARWWYMTFWMVAMTTSLTTSVLLIVAGALLRRRRPGVERLYRAYAYMVLGEVVCIPVHTAVCHWHAGTPLDDAVLSMIATLVGLLATAAFPAYVLVFFRRPGIREQVESWREPTADASGTE
ncbi:MAG TPA: hypothetical protein VM431_10010 [Phycisphaerae bacterium]|nr:hypothetical protein [Phycisphaerae bacterium]